MKNQYHFIKLFCFGFSLATSLNYISSCSKNESLTQPIEDIPAQYSETQEMKSLSDSLVAAFKAEDKNKVLNCTNDEFKEVYAPILNGTTESLSVFGTALEKRKLVFSNLLYAEYEVSINGTIYTIAYANCGDGKWQLVRF